MHPMTTVTPARLTRPASDRVFLGVCSGIARRYGWDPVLVRAAFLATALLGGPGILAYLVLFFVMPQDNAA
jgi:phage shock protein PspC (stress-responsive transcriptional regulator)